MKRRTVLAGLVAIGVAAVGGAALRFTHLFAKHYPPSPYDDLLGQIVDREAAASFGAVTQKAIPDFNLARVTAKLRQGPGLAARARADAAAMRVVEAGGWIVPESVALYAALAARA